MFRIFVILGLAFASGMLFRAIIQSRWYNDLCDSFFGPDPAVEAIRQIDLAEETAEKLAADAEAEAAKKRAGAESIKKRLKKDKYAT